MPKRKKLSRRPRQTAAKREVHTYAAPTYPWYAQGDEPIPLASKPIQPTQSIPPSKPWARVTELLNESNDLIFGIRQQLEAQIGPVYIEGKDVSGVKVAGSALYELLDRLAYHRSILVALNQTLADAQ